MNKVVYLLKILVVSFVVVILITVFTIRNILKIAKVLFHRESSAQFREVDPKESWYIGGKPMPRSK